MTLVAFIHRVVALVRRRRLDRDLDEELAFHLAMREAELRKDGATEADARLAARRRFGSVAYLKEQCHDMWTFHPLETLGHDVRYACRTLRKSPGFTLVAVFALAAGIGGNTAIFSLVNAVRGGALPYPDADRLVEIWGTVQRAKVERRGASYPDFQDWRTQSHSFADMAGFDGGTMTLVGDEPERIRTEFVSAPYFALLGLSPALGRTFRADEDDLGKPGLVAVLSDGLWQRRFGRDPQIVGRTLTLNTRVITVVGVMPPGFTGLTDTAELWLPFALYTSPQNAQQRGNRSFQILARLKPGVTQEAAQQELDVISRRLEAAY